MPRTYAELLSDDPAWPELQKAASSAGNRVEILAPVGDAERRVSLEDIQVTTRSTLGAIAHETGGILVDRGFLRHLGSGCPRLPRRLVGWNDDLGVALSRFIIVADDVVGGVFAIDAGELGKVQGRVHYFAPDSLEWEDTELGHTDFVHWTFEGDLATFYESMRWPGWEHDIALLGGDQSLSIVPPMWTESERLTIAQRDRRPVPANELWRLQQDFAKALGRR
jgi:hypothetical protein